MSKFGNTKTKDLLRDTIEIALSDLWQDIELPILDDEQWDLVCDRIVTAAVRGRRIAKVKLK